MADAIVIAGAVTKGAFAAGVLSELSEPDVRDRLQLDIQRIVATSSGALTAAYYAAAIHAGSEATAGARLAQLWIDEATLARSVSPSVPGIFARRGLSSARKLLRLLRANIRPAVGTQPIELRLVVTNLDGEIDIVGGARATAHEHIFAFDGEDFSSAARLERLFEVVTASAAFPGVFEPVTLSIGGRAASCIDGGATDNAPLGHALRGAPEIARVFLISATPRVQRRQVPLRGLAYATELAEILVDERLVRDTRRIHDVNDALTLLRASVPDPEVHARVLRSLGWTGRRIVDVVEIRPEVALEGSAFAGWFSRRLREVYVEAGRRAVSRVLAERSGPPARGATAESR
jgi:predicted acylesterase/phospholipase RssA